MNGGGFMHGGCIMTFADACLFSLATKELEEVTSDLGFTRNQIITAEVCISRIYNWDVRRKRQLLKSG
jgi:acyl-coenzyme A thioesterase PaaI-like protein